MSSNEQLEQPLWEMIYGLLTPAEEETLRERITSDPEMARAYAKIKLQTELVAAAAKCEDARGLDLPGELLASNERPQEANPPLTMDAAGSPNDDAATPATRSHLIQAANWIVAVAAMGLVVMSAFSLTQLRRPTATSAMADAATSAPLNASQSDKVHIVVATPAVYNADTTNYISVRTSSSDGTPTSTELDFKLFGDAGDLEFHEVHQTDQSGNFQVELPGALAARGARFEVASRATDSPAVSSVARTFRSRYLTHLNTDLPVYQPGQTVKYRSLSLSRFDQRVDGEVAVEYDVLDDQGAPIAAAHQRVTSQRGVGSGEFAIPADATYGKLIVRARSPEGAFPTQKREVQVRTISVPTWNKELKLARESYQPGERVSGQLTVSSHDGRPAVGKKLAIAAFVDQQLLDLEETTASTDQDGKYDVDFTLPQTITRGDAVVTVNVADEQNQEQLAKSIPIHTGRIDVDFFAEGGELAAGLRNEVYFQARNLQGEPVHLEGDVVDAEGQLVARAETLHDGRGRFELTTTAAGQYQLLIEKPAGASAVPLPAVSPDAAVVLHAGNQVLEPRETLDVTLRMREPDRSLVVAAACRGGLVGMKAVERSDFAKVDDGTSEYQLPLKLADEASGVIRVTVYDSGQVPPRPLAERLVFRRPANRLHVSAYQLDTPESYPDVILAIKTTDEQGQATPATLGVSVVNQGLLNAVKDDVADLETHVFLTSEIHGAEELEDANFLLGTSDEAATALDLLLGTQGWRRFVESRLDQVARLETPELAKRSEMTLMTRQTEAFDDLATLSETVGDDALVPVILDNRKAIENARAEVPAPSLPAVAPAWIQSRERSLQRWGTVLLMGGLIVLLAVAVLGAARSLGTPRVWVPSVLMAGIATVMGVFWMGSQVSPHGDVAYAPISLEMKQTASSLEIDDAMVVDAESTPAPGSGQQAQPTAAEVELDALPSVQFRQREGKTAAGRSSRTLTEMQAESATADSVGGTGGGFGGGEKSVDVINREMKRGSKLAENGAAGKGDALKPQQMRRQTDLVVPRTKQDADKPKLPNRGRVVSEPEPPAEAALAETAPKATSGKRKLMSAPFAPPTPAPASRAAGAEAPKAAPVAPALAEAAPTPEPSVPMPSAPKPRATAATAPAAASNAPLLKIESTGAVEQGEEKRMAGVRSRYSRVTREYFLQAGRSRDLPTLVWQPLVITDAEGRASVTFTLPATESTYIFRADAHGNGRIGSTKQVIRP